MIQFMINTANLGAKNFLSYLICIVINSEKKNIWIYRAEATHETNMGSNIHDDWDPEMKSKYTKYNYETLSILAIKNRLFSYKIYKHNI